MLSKELLDHQLTALPLTVSDLLVGLESDDTREVIYQAANLKGKADTCEVPVLRDTAQEIMKTAADKGLDAVRSLIPQLQQHLEQALQLMRQSKATSSS